MTGDEPVCATCGHRNKDHHIEAIADSIALMDNLPTFEIRSGSHVAYHKRCSKHDAVNEYCIHCIEDKDKIARADERAELQKNNVLVDDIVKDTQYILKERQVVHTRIIEVLEKLLTEQGTYGVPKHDSYIRAGIEKAIEAVKEMKP